MSPRPDDWHCGTVLDRLEELVDGDLSQAETAAIERHLDGCSACRKELALAREIRSELRALPQMDAPAVVIERVKTVARQERSAGSPSRVGWRPSPVWALAAAVVLAVVLAPLMMAPESSDTARRAVEPMTIGTVELERATEEVRVALAYVGQVTRRTGLEIRDGLIVERLVIPTAEGLSSLRDAPGADARGEGNET